MYLNPFISDFHPCPRIPAKFHTQTFMTTCVACRKRNVRRFVDGVVIYILTVIFIFVRILKLDLYKQT